MDSLGDIMGKKSFQEPEEMLLIKRYVKHHFKMEPQVLARGKDFVIVVPNAALASSLRLKLRSLQNKLQPGAKLIIRIGQ